MESQTFCLICNFPLQWSGNRNSRESHFSIRVFLGHLIFAWLSIWRKNATYVMPFGSLMKFIKRIFQISFILPRFCLPDGSQSTFWSWKFKCEESPLVIHQKLRLNMYIEDMNFICLPPWAEFGLKSQKVAKIDNIACKNVHLKWLQGSILWY